MMWAVQPTVRPTAKHGENRSGVRPDVAQQQGGVELDVRVQVAAGLLVEQHLDRHPLHFLGEVQRALLAGLLGQQPGRLVQHLGSRIAHLVDAVPEAHDPLAVGDGVPDPGLSAVGRADLARSCPGPGPARRRGAAP